MSDRALAFDVSAASPLDEAVERALDALGLRVFGLSREMAYRFFEETPLEWRRSRLLGLIRDAASDETCAAIDAKAFLLEVTSDHAFIGLTGSAMTAIEIEWLINQEFPAARQDFKRKSADRKRRHHRERVRLRIVHFLIRDAEREEKQNCSPPSLSAILRFIEAIRFGIDLPIWFKVPPDWAEPPREDGEHHEQLIPLNDMARALPQLVGQSDIWMAINPTSTYLIDPKAGRERRINKHVAGLVAIRVDLDPIGNLKHRKGPFFEATPREVYKEALRRLKERGLPNPDVVVCSGSKGFHLYWLHEFVKPGAANRWKLATRKLCDIFVPDLCPDRGASTRANGMMRLPGTYHPKSGRMVELWKCPKPGFKRHNFDKLCTKFGVPNLRDEGAGPKRARETQRKKIESASADRPKSPTYAPKGYPGRVLWDLRLLAANNRETPGYLYSGVRGNIGPIVASMLATTPANVPHLADMTARVCIELCGPDIEDEARAAVPAIMSYVGEAKAKGEKYKPFSRETILDMLGISREEAEACGMTYLVPMPEAEWTAHRRGERNASKRASKARISTAAGKLTQYDRETRGLLWKEVVNLSAKGDRTLRDKLGRAEQDRIIRYIVEYGHEATRIMVAAQSASGFAPALKSGIAIPAHLIQAEYNPPSRPAEDYVTIGCSDGEPVEIVWTPDGWIEAPLGELALAPWPRLAWSGYAVNPEAVP